MYIIDDDDLIVEYSVNPNSNIDISFFLITFSIIGIILYFVIDSI